MKMDKLAVERVVRAIENLTIDEIKALENVDVDGSGKEEYISLKAVLQREEMFSDKYDFDIEIAVEILNLLNKSGCTIVTANYILDFCKASLNYCSVEKFI